MGKIQLHTPEQKTIFDEVKETSFLRDNFYFTGGTALSAFYLHHRYSDDLDFFSSSQFNNEIIAGLVEKWSKDKQFTYKSRFLEVVYSFDLTFTGNSQLKVDFAYYPYERVERGKKVDSFEIDSLLDIAINKLFIISQRTNVKDFVDLYFLLEKFSLWDLHEGVRIKFHQDLEPVLLASDLLKVEDFTFLPQMIKPLELETLQSFFREKAKEVGRQGIIE